MKKLLLITCCIVLFTCSRTYAQCIALFQHSVSSTTLGLVSFSDSSNSANPIISYRWDFGDGATDTGAFVQHIYANTGTYNACLIISDGGTCIDTICAPVIISSIATSVNAYFNIDSMSMFSCSAPYEAYYFVSVNAAGYATSDSVLLEVNYGDGIDSSFYWPLTQSNFFINLSHVFQNPGTYNAQLIVTASDMNADTMQSQPAIISSSCGSLSGNVYQDLNNNCVFDAGDLPLANIGVNIYSGGQFMGWTTTDATGLYSFNVPTGSSYDVQVHMSNGTTWHFQSSCPPSGMLTVNTIPSTGNDFGLTCPQGFDLTGWLNSSQFRPGRSATVCINVYNQRCNTPSGQIELVFNPLVTLIPDSSGTAPYVISGNTVTMAIDSPDLFWSFCVEVIVDSSAQIGDSVCVTMNLTPVTGDSVPGNNTQVFCFPVRNSFDPNDKYVSPSGDGPSGFVRPGTDLTYTIRFQNTGTADAIDIYILDTLDANLDASTVNLIASSHDAQFSLLSGNVLRFSFPNINLPDSNTNEPGSHGFVSYRVKQINNIAHLSTISNTAGIYFDFNPPVITNTTLNTVDMFLSVDNAIHKSILIAYPNPAQDRCFIQFTNHQERIITVVDAIGKQVYQNIVSAESFSLKTADFSEGMYTIHVIENGVSSDSFKLMISR